MADERSKIEKEPEARAREVQAADTAAGEPQAASAGVPAAHLVQGDSVKGGSASEAAASMSPNSEVPAASSVPEAAAASPASGVPGTSPAPEIPATQIPTPEAPAAPIPTPDAPVLAPPPAPFPCGNPQAATQSAQAASADPRPEPAASWSAQSQPAPQPSYGNPGASQEQWARPAVPAVGVPEGRPAAVGGKAIGALVCGVLAILTCETVVFGIILGIVAIVLAGSAIKERAGDGKAVAGRICGIVGLVLSALCLVAYLVLGAIGFAVLDYYGFDEWGDVVRAVVVDGVEVEVHDGHTHVSIGDGSFEVTDW